jgi:hypothetical protein
MHVVIYSLLVANVISLSGCRRRDTSGGPLGVIPDSVSRARCSKELENLSTFHSLSPRTKGNRLPPERDGRTFACWAVCFCFLLFEMSIAIPCDRAVRGCCGRITRRGGCSLHSFLLLQKSARARAANSAHPDLAEDPLRQIVLECKQSLR